MNTRPNSGCPFVSGIIGLVVMAWLGMVATEIVLRVAP